MPVALQTSKLARGLRILFDPENAPLTTRGSAKVWAAAYTDYAIAGGVAAAKAKEPVLASALTKAFNPESGGGGPSLFVSALKLFWAGLPVPEQVGFVINVFPSGSVDSPQPDDATPDEQAQGLAAIIAGFTLGSVKVFINPAGPIVPLL